MTDPCSSSPVTCSFPSTHSQSPCPEGAAAKGQQLQQAEKAQPEGQSLSLCGMKQVVVDWAGRRLKGVVEGSGF